MTAFNEQEIDDHSLDYTILRNGGIALYRKLEFFDQDASQLEQKGYRVVTIDCKTWSTAEAVHESLSKALDFPDYYGRNLNALNDCLCNDLNIPSNGGLLLRLIAFHSAPEQIQKEVIAVLDIGAGAIREWMLSGKRFIVFVQTDDPWARFGELGCVNAMWNRREFLNVNRGA